MKVTRGLQLIAVVALLGLLVGAVALVWALQPRQAERLEVGEHRPFGGFDAHLEVVVAQVQALSEWGEGESRIEPSGELYLVTLEASNTAVSDRFFVDPSGLRVRIRDRRAAEWRPLEATPFHGFRPGLAFATEIGNGEVVRQDFLFDVPRDAEEPAIWISQRSRLAEILPGFEDSLLQQKLVVALPRR